MPGFNYGGGVGDGTTWSSERGTDPTTPGGGYNGHAGDNNNGQNSGGSNVGKTPAQILAEAKAKILLGTIPPNWILEGDVIKRVIPKHDEPYTINGGGRGNDRTVMRTVQEQHIADADLTAAYREGVAQRIVLDRVGGIITDVGEKFGTYLGDKYKQVASELAGDIKSFQGKTIRSFDDAMKSLNKLTANPGLAINQADRNALVNAWNQVNAQDMANKLGNISTAFKVADVVTKVEKVREHSIYGYNTGDWGPLMREAESWAVSGMFAGAAMGVLTVAAPTIAATIGLPVAAVTISGMLGIGYVSSFIDDGLIDKINNELIPSAH